MIKFLAFFLSFFSSFLVTLTTKGYQNSVMLLGYDSNSMFNDIAIIKLREALTWRDEIQPISLPSRDAQAGDMCTVLTVLQKKVFFKKTSNNAKSKRLGNKNGLIN